MLVARDTGLWLSYGRGIFSVSLGLDALRRLACFEMLSLFCDLRMSVCFLLDMRVGIRTRMDDMSDKLGYGRESLGS